jgi:very-short-patch-repair endonuclease
VLRFSSREVLANTEGVVQTIFDAVKARTNPPVPC